MDWENAWLYFLDGAMVVILLAIHSMTVKLLRACNSLKNRVELIHELMVWRDPPNLEMPNNRSAAAKQRWAKTKIKQLSDQAKPDKPP